MREDDLSRVVLVETAEALPGLLPFQAWDAMALAEVIYVRDPQAHPSAEALHFAGIDLERLEPASLDARRIDLGRPGSPDDRRLGRALLDAAESSDRVVYLLGPEDEGLPRVVGTEAVDRDVEVEMVFMAQAPRGTELLRLASIMAQLRDPEGGCPWDLEQDHESLTTHLLEESYELLDAIDRGRDPDIEEELGDVLLQVVFHAQIAQDRGAFGIDDVARGIAEKLVRRHPHVFADVEVADADEVKANWDELKQEEKARTGPFEGVPATLPSLLLAQKLQRRAAKLGFDWPGIDDVVDNVRAELTEVLAAGTSTEREAEIGDLLGAVVALARHLDVDAEQALRRSVATFRSRFEAMLERAEQGEAELGDLDRDAWLSLWRTVKSEGADDTSR